MDSTSTAVDARVNASRLRAGLVTVARDPAVREIARRWRTLTGGERTLLACSGGADSAALVLALASSVDPGQLVVGHVVHDLRPTGQTHADRDFVRDLAGDLGLRFDERAVEVPAAENAEAAARRLRYAALTDMARAHGAGVVAVAHHAEDQLETILLVLLRGAGPRGLSGMRPKRRLAEGVALVRPMLGVSRADAQRLCALAGAKWRTDETNADLSRARAAIRHRVLPVLEEIRPGASDRAAGAAELLHDAAMLVEERVDSVFGEASGWPRERLRAQPGIVVGEGLRRAFAKANSDQMNDRLSRRVVEQAVAHIRSKSGETKVFQWPGGVCVEVDAHTVRVTSPC